MTDERTLEMLRLLLENREWDEVGERYIIDYDEMVRTLLVLPPKPIELDPALTYHVEEVPVINGVATLPDGRTVTSDSNIVRVPVLDA
jgi:hypothetical protein